MTDLREGRIQAFLDAEMEVDAHRQFAREIAADPALAEAVEAQRRRVRNVTSALDAAFGDKGGRGEEGPEVAEGWAAVASRIGVDVRPDLETGNPDSDVDRVGARSPEGHGSHRSSRRWSLAGPATKAAGLILVAAGAAAAAIPGSPLRQWAEARLFSSQETIATTPPVDATPTRTGIQLPTTAGSFRVVLSEAPQAEIRVSVVEGDMVEVSAGPDAEFATSDGRIDIAGATGAVDVRIPETQAAAIVEVSGAVYLRKTGERIEILRAGVDSLPTGFVFSPQSGDPPR